MGYSAAAGADRAIAFAGVSLRLLFKDKRFLVVEKPAGLPVHAGRAGGPSVEDYFPEWRQGRQGPWLAHRLDRDTAGCLAVALKKSALVAAQGMFAAGAVEKIYWAVVRGVPAAAEGVVDLALAKATLGNSWKMVGAQDGMTAVTAWRVLGQEKNCAWIEFSPKTGRTHQIRAHAASMGHPILGDAVYGGGAGKLMLLARSLKIPLAPDVVATADVPDHMRLAMRTCGYGTE